MWYCYMKLCLLKIHTLFCRYCSISFLHQPSWSQKDDPGQKWVHQSNPPPEECCSSWHEHGHQRDLLVGYLPKEDLQVSWEEDGLEVVFFNLFLLPDAHRLFSIQSSNGLGWRLESPQHDYGFRHWRSWRHCFWLDPWQPLLDWQHSQHHLGGNCRWKPPQNSFSPRPAETQGYSGWPPPQVSPTALLVQTVSNRSYFPWDHASSSSSSAYPLGNKNTSETHSIHT